MKGRSEGFNVAPTEDMAVVEALFREYETELDEDICFQGFEEELSTLPGKYASPGGAILLGTDMESELAAGIVALRPFGNSGQCEMKRMFVRPEFRGKGLARRLALEIIQLAREMGYTEMVLDTLPKLQPAIELYKELGFMEIPPYYHNPIPGVVYMGKKLSNWA